MKNKEILDKIRMDITPELYNEIRDLWKRHSIAEDNRDIPGLMSTLTDDCVYEIPQKGVKWVGIKGATEFYQSLLGAFPDIEFYLQHIVIGPQGVYEEAFVTGTHKGKWLDYEPTGEKVEFNVSILFPWDPVKRKFSGERVFSDYF